MICQDCGARFEYRSQFDAHKRECKGFRSPWVRKAQERRLPVKDLTRA